MSDIIDSNIDSASTVNFLTKDWVEDSYTGDQLINAFLAGKEKGEKDLREKIREDFIKKLNRAQAESEQFAHYVQDKFDIHFESVRLKFYDLNTFKSLIIVDNDSYFSDNMKEVYKIIDERLDQINEEDFSLNFSFTHSNNEIQTETLLLDGYFIRYERRKQADHNKKVYEHLRDETEFHDWLVTTAYYCANHIVKAKIFPFKTNGKPPIPVHNFESYCLSSDSSGNSKHEKLARLVRKKLGRDVGASFRMLLDECDTARYREHQFSDPKKTRKSVQDNLDIIWDACTK